MGLDFIRKAAPQFRRALDRRAAELRTPTLFSRDVPLVCRAASADVCNDAQLVLGEKLLLRMIDQKLVAQRDNFVVAEFPAPPLQFVNHITTGAGVGAGQITAVHRISGTVEVEICL